MTGIKFNCQFNRFGWISMLTDRTAKMIPMPGYYDFGCKRSARFIINPQQTFISTQWRFHIKRFPSWFKPWCITTFKPAIHPFTTPFFTRISEQRIIWNWAIVFSCLINSIRKSIDRSENIWFENRQTPFQFIDHLGILHFIEHKILLRIYW